MERDIDEVLRAWLDRTDRRPLVLRGARQVGKTFSVRALARSSGRELIELNFERDPEQRRIFANRDPKRIIADLSLLTNREIAPDRSLLFLDEVQAAGEVLACLRWFYEEMPALPVVAAGSLLEFALADHALSMPVGRVTFRHLEPMSFPEYLLANGQGRLRATLAAWRPGADLSETAHQLATTWFDRYMMVGGMPAAVAADVAGQTPQEVRTLQQDLMATFRADFGRYAGRMDRDVLGAVLQSVAASIGRKFIYAHAGEGLKQHHARRALELLAQARLCHLVRHTAANGPPLAAEVKDGLRKAVLLDIGLLHALLGTPARLGFPTWEALAPALRGQLFDQIGAQSLRQVADHGADGPELYYWQREGGRPGEIDYLVQLEGRILPIELKSGPAGAMKSLHQFMFEKRLPLTIRADRNPPAVQDVSVKTTQGQPVAYRLISVPGYLLWNLGAVVWVG